MKSGVTPGMARAEQKCAAKNHRPQDTAVMIKPCAEIDGMSPEAVRIGDCCTEEGALQREVRYSEKGVLQEIVCCLE